MNTLYLLSGEEEALAAKWLEEKLSAWVPPEWRPFNFHRINLTRYGTEELINLLQSFPMGSDYRVVVWQEISKVEAGRRKQLPKLLEKLPESTIVLLWFISDSPADTKKIIAGKEWENVLSKASKVSFTLRDSDRQKWLRKALENQKLSLTEEAEAYLFEMTGGDLNRIESELAKLSLLRGSLPVTKPTLAEMVSGKADASIFDLFDSLGQRKAKKTLRVLNALLEEGEPPVRLLAAITNHFRLLWQIQCLAGEGVRQQDMGKRIGIHPFRVRKGLEQVRNFSAAEFPKFMDWLSRADWSLKTGRQEPDYLLQTLVATICKA